MKKLLIVAIVFLALTVGVSKAEAAVAFVSSSTMTYTTRTNTTITAPASISNGNLLVIYFADGIAGTPPTPTPPTGFKALTTPITVTSGGFSVKNYVWWKIAASESGNYTITHTSATTEAYMVNYSGTDQTTPFVASSTNSGTGVTTTGTGITPTRDGTMIMFGSQDWGSNTAKLSAPTGSTPTFTKRYNGVIQFVADGILGTAGATGNKTITNNSAAGEPWSSIMLGIQPPAASGTVAPDDGLIIFE